MILLKWHGPVTFCMSQLPVTESRSSDKGLQIVDHQLNVNKYHQE